MGKIFNIEANYNFLETLAHWILEQYGSDLIYLSNVTILLPSRRSCRKIKEILLKKSNKKALILPNIKAIGDIDFEEIALLQNSNIDLEPSSHLKYRSLLIDEIKKFNQQYNLFGKNLNASQANLIASDLEKFLDEIEREELNLDDLENITEHNLASHKQKILSFLRNFGSNWHNILIKNNIRSLSSYQKNITDANSDFIKCQLKKFPIIAAGSTGSFQATTRLLKNIFDLDYGIIFMFGLDNTISNENFEAIAENHPQFMFKKLLKNLNVARNEIENINYPKFKLRNEQSTELLSLALLPTEKTEQWSNITNLNKKSLEKINLIECKNQFDEAKIIALIMIKELGHKNDNIALVTNDANLAMLVKENLAKFNINIDNSQNENLANSEIANYIYAIAHLLSNDFKIANLLTILKHKITKVGFEDNFYLKNLKLFETEILRQHRSLKNLDIILEKVLQHNNTDLQDWFKKIYAILDNFLIKKKENSNFLEILSANIKCSEELSKNNLGQDCDLKILKGFDEFIEFFNEVQLNLAEFIIEDNIYHKILEQFLGNYSFEEKINHHPRLHILSPIEARSLNFDSIIISNLNEGEFGKQSAAQNWLSENMRIEFGLPSFKRRFGVAAFDFSNYFNNKKVFLTRSLFKNNSPTNKSHILLKIETVLKAAKIQNNYHNQYWPNFLKNLDLENSTKILKHDNKNSKILAKLKDDNSQQYYDPQDFIISQISATDIGKWVRNPYFIYAKRILQLKSLNKIDEEASFLDFGNFIHETLENFIKEYDITDPSNQLLNLTQNYGKKYFSKYFINQDAFLLWWPKFINIAQWFVKNEEKIREKLQKTIVEKEEKIKILNIDILTKIDRINFNKNADIEIIDYKTGLIPSYQDIKNGLESQLAIEAMIFLNNNNSNINSVESLSYYSLSGKDDNKIVNIKDHNQLIEATRLEIEKLINKFSKNPQNFYKMPNLRKYKNNEYSHLQRVIT